MSGNEKRKNSYMITSMDDENIFDKNVMSTLNKTSY